MALSRYSALHLTAPPRSTMVLELHIWGPGFSLPSIDPECLAAVAYCTHAVPRGKWALVASNDPSLSPTTRPAEELPTLRDGPRWIGGYGNIIAYLRHHSNGHWDLDRDLDPHQSADCTAFSALLRTHLAPLLALSLYVSSANYPLTRTAYSRLLPWPTQYLIPPHLRAAAKSQTQHLGLSSLDTDTDTDAPAQAPIPPSLRTPKPALATTLQLADLPARFKLDALMLAALEPLRRLLAHRTVLLGGTRPSSLDCLALGYLSLALVPALPQSWLADGLEAKYAPLCRYARDALRGIGGMDIRLEHALDPAPLEQETETPGDSAGESPGALPWQTPPPRAFTAVAAVMLQHAFASMPFFSSPPIIRPDSSFNSPPSQAIPFAAAALGLVAGLACAGLFGPSDDGAQKRNLADMGEAGAMLAMGGGLGGR